MNNYNDELLATFLNNNQATFITPNRRLSAGLRQYYNQSLQEQGNKIWPTLDIIPYPQWLQRCYQRLQHHYKLNKLLLNELQEQVLFQTTIERYLSEQQYQGYMQSYNLASTAQLAQQAWRICNDYFWDPSEHMSNKSLHHYSEEVKIFQQWLTLFKDTCSQNQWLTPAELGNYLLKQLRKKIHFQQPAIPDNNIAIDESMKNNVTIENTTLNKKMSNSKTSSSEYSCCENPIIANQLFFLGFDEFNPCQQAIIDCCQKQSISVTCLPLLNTATTDQKRIAFDNTETEIITMARWLKKNYQQNSHQRIACIVPNLTELRQTLLRLVKEVFLQETILDFNAAIPINISGGESLIQQTVIKTALELIKLNGEDNISIHRISYLLLTPYIGKYQYESNQRAQLDAYLKQQGVMQWQIQNILNIAQEKKLCPDWCQRINALVECNRDFTTMEDGIVWCTEQLTMAGWPGNRPLHSQEHQCIDRWHTLLTELTPLAITQPNCNKESFIHYLEQTIQNHVFQIRTDDAPIQILGTLEAAGQQFDKIWCLNFTEDNWPTAAKPNPYIPYEIQKQLKMPHADHQRELTYCQTMLRRFQHSCKELLVSYPTSNDDRPCQVSPLCQTFKEINVQSLQLADYANPYYQISNTRQLEHVVDDYGTEIQNTTVIRGGTSVFKNQALCPFRAYAYHRLQAEGLAEVDFGLNALERGSLIHRCLELFWQQIKDQKTLQALSDEAIKCHIHETIKQALYELQQRRMDILTERYFQLEQIRLEKLMQAWLNLETQRTEFTIHALEEKTTLTIDDLIFEMRIDRIDKMSDGTHVIIDYKTGRCNINDWFGERPIEPQLPLYSLSDTADVVAILFGQCRPGDITIKGYSANSMALPSIIAISDFKHPDDINSWSLQIATWKKHLTALASEFKNGYAKVEPQQTQKACAYCDLHSLCRIQQQDEY